MIDAELDLMPNAARLDDRHPGRFGVAPKLAVNHVAHSEDGLERVPLSASRRGA